MAPINVHVRGTVSSDSAEMLLHAVIARVGIVRLGDFLGADALASGALVPVLSDCHHGDPQPITALISPERQSIPRIRAFVDFLKSIF